VTEHPRKPTAFRIDEPDVPKPSSKTRAPRAVPARNIVFEEEAPDQQVAVVPPVTEPPAKRFRWGTVLLSALAGLISLWAGLAITTLVEDLFARSEVFGWIGLGVATLAGLAAAAIIIREAWGLLRLHRIESIQTDAALAINVNDTKAASRVTEALKTIYAGRADTQLGFKALNELAHDIIDPRDRVRLAETHLLAPLDEISHRIIARMARRVTLLTTITPAAALDILFVAALNLRMLRELATLYGGRPSTLSTLRLARMVLGHLAVTGGLALSDSLLQHLLGKGLVGRLSARFGEGAVNGILTARIGLAARDVCRPIPQDPHMKETLTGLIKELANFESDTEHEPRKSQS
jgi:putative membrane protein